MAKVSRKRLERMVKDIWYDAKQNWTYGGEGADCGRSPVGWVISSDSGIMGKLKKLVDELDGVEG